MIDYENMAKYAKALREAAEAERSLVGSLLTEDEKFGPTIVERAERVENVLRAYMR